MSEEYREGLGVSWEEFRYSYVESSWFDSDRAKTLKAMRRLWERIRPGDLDHLPSVLVVCAFSVDKLGEVVPYAPIHPKQRGAFLYLSPHLEGKSQPFVNRTVAHEFAHTILHPERGTIEPDSDHDIEQEADDLIKTWGYQGAYSKREH